MQTDFYLLVVAAVYHADGLWGHATFDLYPRAALKGAPWVVAAGMHEAARSVLDMRFDERSIAWLKEQQAFSRASEGWWESLRHFAFSGDIHAVAEGTLVGPHTPILRVTAPLQHATLIQTRLHQMVPAATAVATRAARCTLAAGGRRLYEFASRRSASGEGAALTARAAIVGGFYASSNAAAAAQLGVPVMGTLSSDFFTAYGDIAPALEAFSVHFPDVGFVNLPPGRVDQAVAQLAQHRELVRMVRLDHPQLARAARALRPMLDKAGMSHTRILGSGSLGPEAISRLGDAPIDLLAVGKNLVRGGPIPTSYRIAEQWRGPDAVPSLKPGSARYPGTKQVLRRADHDLVCLLDEADHLDGEPLLQPLILNGELVSEAPSVQEGRDRCAAQLADLPPELLPGGGGEWDLRVSEGIGRLMA